MATKRKNKPTAPKQAASKPVNEDAVAAVEAAPVQPPIEAKPEQPRSRYDEIALDEQDDSIYLPPHVNFEGMTKDEISATSMRYLGHRPLDGTKDAQISQVRRELRAGLPGYGRRR